MVPPSQSLADQAARDLPRKWHDLGGGDGSAEAAEELFRRYYLYGVGHARRLGAESHTAEDLGAEAFIRLWHRLDGPAPVRSVPAYLRMVVHNLYVDDVRRSAPVRVGIDPSRDTSSEVDVAEMVGSCDAVATLLAQLSDRHRRVLELTVIQGLSLAEAAKIMGTSPGSAAVLAHRARAAARRAFLRGEDESRTVRSGRPTT